MHIITQHNTTQHCTIYYICKSNTHTYKLSKNNLLISQKYTTFTNIYICM